MLSLPVPQIDTKATFLRCASDTNREDLKQRLLRSMNKVMEGAVAYLEAATSKSWYTLPHSIQPLPAADDELKDLYPRTMSAAARAGRTVYDTIFNSSPHGICPLCGQGKVFTLDHYLPRSRYAHFATLPANLVPSCRDCNFAKREQFPSAKGEQTFHPYFDSVDGERCYSAT
jgi:5-methylcytosine-specific restriction endonuclease McrA